MEPARRLGDIEPSRASRAGQRSRFVAAQDISAARGPVPQDDPVLRRYLLAGLLACGMCGRRMESAWSNGKACGVTGALRWLRPRRRHLARFQLLVDVDDR